MLIRRKKGEFMGEYYLGQKVKLKNNGEVTEIIGIDMESFIFEPMKETDNIIKIKKILKEEGMTEDKFRDFVSIYFLIKNKKMTLNKLEWKVGYTYIECIAKENNLSDKELDEFFTYHTHNTNNCFVLVRSNDVLAKPIGEIRQGETVIYYGRKTTKVIWKATDELEKQD